MKNLQELLTIAETFDNLPSLYNKRAALSHDLQDAREEGDTKRAQKILDKLQKLSDQIYDLEQKSKRTFEERLDEGKDLDELIDAWMERNNAWRTEGPKGVQNFEKLIRALGYHNIDSFLEDNPGAIEAMFEWVKEQKVQEWKEALSEFDDHDDEEDKE